MNAYLVFISISNLIFPARTSDELDRSFEKEVHVAQITYNMIYKNQT